MRLGPRRKVSQWRVEASELIHEIVATADVIVDARDAGGERIVPNEALWSLLRAVERTHGCPSISDLARAMRVSRQRAHELVRHAAQTGYVELLTNRDDRRILQVELTPRARSRLADARGGEAQWVVTLLNGLDMREIRRTAGILRVIRQRLKRNERARAAP